jgi:Uma2 family endonuclease
MAIADTDPAVAESRTLRRRMTEEQFVVWSLKNQLRAEWVDGEVQVMNAVEWGHHEFTEFLTELLRRFVRLYQLGQVAGEPYQVRLPRQRRRRQPDVYFIRAAQAALIERMQFNGVPDLIVEVVSPDSQTRDRQTKFGEYERAGVPEYWLPDPTLRTFEAYVLGPQGRYTRLPERDGRVCSTALAGVFFRPDWLRQLHPPEVDPLLAEMSAERQRLLSSPPPPTSDKPVA